MRISSILGMETDSTMIRESPPFLEKRFLNHLLRKLEGKKKTFLLQQSFLKGRTQVHWDSPSFYGGGGKKEKRGGANDF